MTSADWALQEKIHAVLTSDAATTGLLGGQHVYDDVPRGLQLPYVTFGRSTVSDWSTASDDGEEHVITLHVWSEGGGRKQALAIMDAMRNALHEAPLTLSGHRLVNLRHELSEARRDADGETIHGIVRLRARTEPLP
ncbi:MAG: hypothetical protein RLZ98_1966 [Pseudomonadota bacterium]|jgi:hypothetical protein